MTSAEKTVLEAANQITNVEEVLDVRAVAASFVAKRLNNSLSIEDIRRNAIQQLSTKVNEESKPGFLLSVIETLGNQSAVDFTSLSKVQVAPAAGAKGVAASPIAAMFGIGDTNVEPSTAAPTLPKEAYGLLDKLVVAADSIINARIPARVAEVVEVMDVKPRPAKKAIAKKKVTLATAKKSARPK